MKKAFTPVVSCIFLFSFFVSNSQLFGQCVNADFSDGNFTNWTATYGKCTGLDAGGDCFCAGANPTANAGFLQGALNAPSNSATQYSQTICSSGFDANLAALGVNIPCVYPGNAYSARLGSTHAAAEGETLTYSFPVTLSDCNFTYHYAVVLEDGGHAANIAPFFHISVTDGSGNAITCAGFQVDGADATAVGFDSLPNGGTTVHYKNWTSVFVPLNNYIGQTVSITFTTESCYPAGTGCGGPHYAYAYIAAECSPLQIISSSPTVCGGQNVTLTAPAGAASYSWSGPGVVAPLNGQTVAITEPGQYICNMTTFGNPPCSFTLDTIVPPSPNNPDADFSATTVCAGSPTTFTDLSIPAGSITKWYWDFNNNGTINDSTQNPTYTFSTPGIYPVKLTIVWPPCTADTTINVVVTGPPTPTFTAPGTLCEGSSGTITYTGNAPSTDTYTWNFNGGTPATGNTQGPYQVSWSTGGTKNITLTVAAGTCSADTTVQVVVNAIPGITAGPDTTICLGASVNLVAANGTSYTWSPNTNLSGTTGATVTATPTDTITYTVSDVGGACPGLSIVTVNVNPIPTSTFTAPGPVCAGQDATITYTGNAGANALYGWSFSGGNPATGITQGPYQVSWASSGTPNISLVVVQNGCPSLPTTVPITVNPIPTSTFSVTSPVCILSNSAITYTGNAVAGATYTWGFAGGTVASGTGQGPYAVNWPSPGTEDVTLSVTQNGCNSTTTTMPVSVTQIPTSTFTTVSPVCALQNSTIQYTGNAPANATYTWNFDGGTATGSGQGPYTVSWADSGTQYITLSVTEGTCSSPLDTDSVIVHPTPSSAFTLTTPVCEGYGSIITYTGADSVGATYSWNFNGGIPPTGNTTGPDTIGWTSVGTDSVILVVTKNGCSSRSGNVVMVVAIPTSTFTVTSPVCAGKNSAIQFTGNATAAGSAYTWNFGGGTPPTGTTQGPYAVSWDSAGIDTVSLWLLAQDGCPSDTTIQLVTVNAVPASFAGDDTSFCSGDSALIGTASTAGYTYSWAPAAGLSNPAIANPYADGTATNSPVITKYIVTTSQGGCSSSDSVVVTVNPNPMPAYTVPAGQCFTGNSFNFVAGGTYLPTATFAWSFGANGTPATSTTSTQTVSFSAIGNQTVNLTISQNTCVNTFVDSVTVYPEPVAGFAPDSTLGCPNFNVCFTNTSVNTANATYLWTFGDGSTSALDTPCHTYGPPGEYGVTLIVTANGCADTATADTIKVIPNPTALFSESATVVQLPHGNVAFLNQSQNAVSYLWEFGDSATSTAFSPQYTFTDSGEYNIVLTAYNHLGCPDSTQQLVIVVPPDNFYIPNVFAPTGNGVNDEFYIYAQPGAIVQSFRVFDRWGEKVHDGTYPWDGNYRGKPAPQGVYVYEFELGLVNNTYTVIKKGSVTLLR